MPSQTHTIAVAIMECIETRMENSEAMPDVMFQVVSLDGVYNEGSFYMLLDDGSRFRVDVIRTG